MRFDDHPAFEKLAQSFENWDRDGVRRAVQALNEAATTPQERAALGEIGAQALQRLGLIVLDELPPEADRAGIEAWTVGVAEDLLAHGALVNGSKRQQRFDDDEEPWRWPIELAGASRNWALVRTLLAHGANPLVHDMDQDETVSNRSVVRAMLNEPTAAVALNLLDVMKLSPLDHRHDGERHVLAALSLSGLAEHPTWTLDDRMAVLRRMKALHPETLKVGGALDLISAVVDARVNAVEARLLLGVSINGSTVKELQMPPDTLTGRPRTAMNGLMHEGYTPLHAAVYALVGPVTTTVGQERDKILALLLAHGASVNAATSLGVTPLHLAAMRGQMPVVERLLAHGADGLQADADGASPLVWAQRAGHSAIAARLIAAEQQALRDAIESTPSAPPVAPRSRL